MRLSIVIPFLNEEGSLRPLYERLIATTAGIAESCELLFIDDGSTDGSVQIIRDLAQNDPNVRLIVLSRNFGHEVASTCGLDHADGDAVVLIDADLQDPPELIVEMVRLWREGYQVVYAQRRRRKGESWFRRIAADVFYRVLKKLADLPIPADVGDFRLMDRRVVQAVRQCRENPRFVRGLVSWAGFKQTAVLYDRDPRHAGQTKYNPLKLLRLSLEAIAAFSLIPLRLITILGLTATMISMFFAAKMAIERLFFAVRMPWNGYALLACAVFFLGGVQLMMLGVLGHYLGLVFRHTQGRPLYIIADQTGKPENTVNPPS